ncbi:MAG: hypothetical protein KIT09_24550 [Bryobacteraceae bacterium]|nr:hypothetical protein [Bryobacteraceae bacterium]
MTADGAGNTYIAGKTLEADPAYGFTLSRVTVTKLDPEGRPVYTFRFAGSAEAKALAADSRGNLFVVGALASRDFPVVNGLAGPAPGYSGDGFISKLDPTGTRLLFSTVFGYTTFNAVAIDANDNPVVAGTTSTPDFPVTSGAFQQSAPEPDSFGRPSFAVVTRLSNSGDRILHSSFLGDKHTACSGGSVCIGRYGASSARSIAIGRDGAITIGGSTTTDRFPVTAEAFQATCKCTEGQPRPPLGTGFVARFSMDLSALQWSTYLGGSGFPIYYYGDRVSAVRLGSDGGVVVTGVAGSPDFPVTAGAFQPEYLGHRSRNGFLAKFDPTGSTLMYATYLGPVDSDLALGLDSNERPWITGQAVSSVDFPLLPDSLKLGNDFAMGLSSNGAEPVLIALLPNGSAGTAIAPDPQGRMVLLGPTGSVLRIPATGPVSTAVLGQANAAGYAVSHIVAPGEIVSLYGTALGPAVGVGAQLDLSGSLATELAGVRVLFDGKPAPLLYVGMNQVNAIVPFEVAARSSTSVQTIGPDGSSSPVVLAVTPSDPQIFFGAGGYAAAINQDGSINSEANPAAPGSVLAFYVNGAGVFDASLADGTIVAPPLPIPVLPLTATFDQAPAEVVYAGAAPGIVAGVVQVNIRIPERLLGNTHTAAVKVGDSASPSRQVAAREK